MTEHKVVWITTTFGRQVSTSSKNDRFAAVSGAKAIRAYGQRIRYIGSYFEKTGAPLHSERLLAHALKKADVTVHRTGIRASRIRAGGERAHENFDHPLYIQMRGSVLKGLNRLGLGGIRLAGRRNRNHPEHSE